MYATHGLRGWCRVHGRARGKFYVIQDESTLGDLLNEEDLAGLGLVKILEFATCSDRAAYICERGWNIGALPDG